MPGRICARVARDQAAHSTTFAFSREKLLPQPFFLGGRLPCRGRAPGGTPELLNKPSSSSSTSSSSLHAHGAASHPLRERERERDHCSWTLLLLRRFCPEYSRGVLSGVLSPRTPSSSIGRAGRHRRTEAHIFKDPVANAPAPCRGGAFPVSAFPQTQ